VSICFYRLNTVELYVSLREEWSEVSKGTHSLGGFGVERRGLTSIQLAVTDDTQYHESMGVFTLCEGLMGKVVP
jgi:hypothetical protein